MQDQPTPSPHLLLSLVVPARRRTARRGRRCCRIRRTSSRGATTRTTLRPPTRTRRRGRTRWSRSRRRRRSWRLLVQIKKDLGVQFLALKCKKLTTLNLSYTMIRDGGASADDEDREEEGDAL